MTKLQDLINRIISDPILLITDYVKTEWAMLVRPKKTLSKLMKGTSLSFRSGSFLIVNILVAYLVGNKFGYKIKGFPFKIPILEGNFKPLGDISFIVLRFMFGILIFLSIFAFLTRRYKFNAFSSRVLSIICYASAIFLPLVLAKSFWNQISCKVFTDLMSQLISSLSIHGLKFNITDFIVFLFCSIIVLSIFIWWIVLLYLGFSFLDIFEKKKLVKIISLSLFLFWIIQIFMASVLYVNYYSDSFKSLLIIICQDIDRELSHNPPNYFKAALFAGHIARDKSMPPYFRYAAYIRQVTYQLMTPLFREKDSAYTLNKSLAEIKNRNYRKVYFLLNKYLEKKSAEIINPKRSFYQQALKELKEADKIYNDPNFVYRQEEVRIFYVWPPSPITILP